MLKLSRVMAAILNFRSANYSQHIQKLDFDHVTAVSSLMDRLLDLSKNSLQYGNSMCPSMIRKLKVIVYFAKFFFCQNSNIFVL
jgi:hypothetical protein